MFRPQFLGVAAVAAALLLSVGCARTPRAIVEDFDSYKIVQIGELQFLADQELELVETGRGFAVFQSNRVPNTIVRVAKDSSPPRELRFDANAEKRRMLREIPNSGVTSTQYRREGDREIIRMHVRGEGPGSTDRHGVLLFMREGQNTAIVRVVGPFSRRADLTQLSELVSRRISLTGDDSLLIDIAGE